MSWPSAGRLLFVNASQVVTCAGPPRARRGSEMADAGVRTDVVVAVAEGRIVGVGSLTEMRTAVPKATEIDCRLGVLIPGFVDSHTHALFGRARYDEQELRASGLDYMEIARRGGGIHASVKDLRQREEGDLFDLAYGRLVRLAAFGTTTVEVKSGYGLSVDDEIKSLRVIAKLASQLPMRIVATFLGAHEIPLEFREPAARRAEYVDLVCEQMIPAVAREGLATFADVFCETGVFSVPESRRILQVARAAGMRLKLHADELTSCGGAELAAELNATSADHLAAVSDAGIAALAGSDTVATALPGTMLFLGKTAQAPVRRLMTAGVPVAIATDFNPGTSPTVNMPLMLTLGVSQLRLSASETIIAATTNGAAALDLASQTGQIAPGHSADLALFAVRDYREIPYWYGDNLCAGTWVRGKACYTTHLGLT